MGKKDGVLWTETRAAIQWTTHTIDFLPHHITTVATTGRRTEQLLLTKVSDRDRNVKVDKVWLWLIYVYIKVLNHVSDWSSHLTGKRREKVLNFQRSVRGRYCTALSYDVIHAAYLFCLHLRKWKWFGLRDSFVSDQKFSVTSRFAY